MLRVDVTGLVLTLTPALWDGQISGEEVNGCMGAPRDWWGEVAGAEPALTLALKGKELSRGSHGEPEVGEAGKLLEDGLCERDAEQGRRW